MPDVRPHHAVILAALQAVTGLNVFDGEVPATPPVDTDGRVHPYAVLYLGAGEPLPSSLAFAHNDLDLDFTVTCAGGDPNRCLWAIDEVRGALVDVRLVVTGRQLSRISQRPGNPGTIRRDDAVSPPRHYLPLPLRLRSIPA